MEKKGASTARRRGAELPIHMPALGPVIALLMQSASKFGGGSYTPSSYVKWLELAGARVTLVPYDASDALVDATFNVTNGALFIGGGSDTPRAARRFYANMKAAHAANVAYPIWGTCDGFEWLMQIAAEDDAVLTNGFDSENMSVPLNLTAAAARSRLLAEAATTPVQGTTTEAGGRVTILQALATRAQSLCRSLTHASRVSPSSRALFGRPTRVPRCARVRSCPPAQSP